MNANNWPLDDMQRTEFTVPYPLEECVRRIEGLHEKRNQLRHYRIAVARYLDKDLPTTYSVGWLYSWMPFDTDSALAEVDVQFQPRESGTRIVVFLSRHWTTTRRSYIAGLVAGTGLTLMCSIGALSSSIRHPDVLCTFIHSVFVMSLAVVGYRWLISRQAYLIDQVHKAFGVIYNPKRRS